ncbi:MAG: phosphopyruvate hydratase [Patescibacteria group bacterium]|nr:phosphopyruvate hydratase [Patescibacteria group bacterium]
MKIEDIKAIQILDSRGNPTLRVSVKADQKWGDFSVPSGASTGTFEAHELRDGGKAYHGLGVEKAIKHIDNEIKEALVGQDVFDQKNIDRILTELDGTENKSKLGANAILGVSGASTRLASKMLNLPLYKYIRAIFEQDGKWQPDLKLSENNFVMPKMFFNILNGGKHADNNVDIQETMIMPNRDSVAENVKIAAEVYMTLKEIIKSKQLNVSLGDEGGFAPDLESNNKALDLVLEAIVGSGYKPGEDVYLALDVAANELYKDDSDEKYVLNGDSVSLSAVQLVSLYKEFLATYPIISIEDGLAEEDWDGWKMMSERIGDKVQLVGDDLFVTNVTRIQKGIDLNAANSVLIKMNQIGTITETFDAIKLARANGYKVFVSHRSGETEDSYIADLVVGTGAGQIKAGAPARGERTSKYNRLLEIEKELNG